jgi:hypothetical protein
MDTNILGEMITQNRVTSHVSFDRVTDNARFRLNEGSTSIGFIYRHVGETINLFAQVLGTPADVTNTTIGQTDAGQRYDVSRSRELIERGYRHTIVTIRSGLVRNAHPWKSPAPCCSQVSDLQREP